MQAPEGTYSAPVNQEGFDLSTSSTSAPAMYLQEAPTQIQTQTFAGEQIHFPSHIHISHAPARPIGLSLQTLNLPSDFHAYAADSPFSANGSPFASAAASSPAALVTQEGFAYQAGYPVSARDSPSGKSSSSSPSSDTSASPLAPVSMPALVNSNDFPHTNTNPRKTHAGGAVNSMTAEMATSSPPKAPNQKSNSDTGPKRSRRVWSLALEKYLFTPHEIATLAAPHRRAIYLASLEAHIDRLHSQLFSLKLYTVDIQDLNPYKGLNSKFAKSIVSGLQQDHINARRSLLEIEREIQRIQRDAPARQLHERFGVPAPSLEDLQEAQAQAHAPALANSQSSR